MVDQGQDEVLERRGEVEVDPPAPTSDGPGPPSAVCQGLASLWQGDGGHFVADGHGLLQLNQSQVVVPVGLILEVWMENDLEGTKVKYKLVSLSLFLSFLNKDVHFLLAFCLVASLGSHLLHSHLAGGLGFTPL